MMRHYGIILGIGIIVFWFCNSIQPWVNSNLSGDFDRTKFILETLNKGTQAEIVILGNSIGMSCIDAKTLSKQLPGQPLCYNLSSNGQLISESSLLYPLIKPDTKLVIQMLRSSYLEEDIRPIPKNVLRNYHLSGYTSFEETNKLHEKSIGLEYITQSSSFQINYDQRGSLVDQFNSLFRDLISAERLSKNEELYFPSAYNEKVDSKIMQQLIKEHNPPKPLTETMFNTDIEEYYKNIYQYFKKRDIDFLLVVYPYNPSLYHYTKEYKQHIKNKLSSYSAPSLSLMNQLSNDDFVDDWHVSKEGAQKLTHILAKELTQQEYAF